MEEYTPLYDFNMLLDSIPEYAKNERVKKINERIDALESYVEKMAKHESILKMISEMRSKLAQRLNMSVTKDEFTSKTKSLEAHITSLEKELKEKQGLINELELKMTDNKKDTKLKLDKVEFYEENQKLWKNFDLYGAFQNLADFEGRVNPVIHDGKDRVVQGMDMGHQNKEIIKRFDEVLLNKASKFSIKQLYENIKVFFKVEDFKNFKENNDKIFSHIQEKLKEFDQNITMVEMNLSEELADAINRVEKDIRNKIFNQIGGKPLNKKEVLSLISGKADKGEVYGGLKTKVGKDDIHRQQVLISKMHDHMKYIAHFSKELLLAYFSKDTRTEHEILNNNASLSVQIDKIYKWIGELDAECLAKNDKPKEELNMRPLNLKHLKLPKRAFYLLNRSFKRNSMTNIGKELNISRNSSVSKKYFNSGRKHYKSQNKRNSEFLSPLTNNTIQLLNNSVQNTARNIEGEDVKVMKKGPLTGIQLPNLFIVPFEQPDQCEDNK